jgi:hypothetical protein
MAGIEWRRRVILDAELNRPGGHLTCNLRYDTQTEIDTRVTPPAVMRLPSFTILDFS